MIHIYTDGSADNNKSRCGGWAYIIIDEDGTELERYCGGEKDTTNNRMELKAIIEALEDWSSPINDIIVYTDSSYVHNGINSWIEKWKKNGWITAAKTAVLNKDLWEKLDQLRCHYNISFKKVPAHVGIKYNEIVDNMAVKARHQIEKLEA